MWRYNLHLLHCIWVLLDHLLLCSFFDFRLLKVMLPYNLLGHLEDLVGTKLLSCEVNHVLNRDWLGVFVIIL